MNTPNHQGNFDVSRPITENIPYKRIRLVFENEFRINPQIAFIIASQTAFPFSNVLLLYIEGTRKKYTMNRQIWSGWGCGWRKSGSAGDHALQGIMCDVAFSGIEAK